jgi:lipid II:glycine glycyltransferase (peptidoglycan interpeptide bridge formation enzyme)
MLWAHASGASELDLGGITSGGPGDPLAGISEFKRSFSGRELEVGREMLSVLKPSRYALFRAVRGVTEKLRR